MHNKLMWIGRVISGLLALLFAMSGVMKLMGGSGVTEGMAHMGLPESLRIPLGILELSCVVAYLISATSIMGAILLTGYVGGAVVTHLRVGEPVYIQIALGIFVWFGLYLREPRLKALIPIRTADDADARDSGSGRTPPLRAPRESETAAHGTRGT